MVHRGGARSLRHVDFVRLKTNLYTNAPCFIEIILVAIAVEDIECSHFCLYSKITARSRASVSISSVSYFASDRPFEKK